MFFFLTFALIPLDEKPPPLSEEQVARIQVLVRKTQETMTRLRGELDEKQKQLAQRYAEYDLDEGVVKQLQADVADRQKQLLDAYHGMHVELRKIVGRERFVTLRQRIDSILNPPRKEK